MRELGVVGVEYKHFRNGEMDILVGQKQGKIIQLTQLESHFEDGVEWSNTSKQKVVADMKMTELNFLLSFFICGTVRSNVKVGVIESEATFFLEFFFVIRMCLFQGTEV